MRDDRLGLGVERLDVDAAGRRLDPHLAPADDAMEPALVPEVRAVEPERAEALRREREVERLRDGEERQGRTLAPGPPLQLGGPSRPRSSGLACPGLLRQLAEAAAAWSAVESLSLDVDERGRLPVPFNQRLYLLHERLHARVELLEHAPSACRAFAAGLRSSSGRAASRLRAAAWISCVEAATAPAGRCSRSRGSRCGARARPRERCATGSRPAAPGAGSLEPLRQLSPPACVLGRGGGDAAVVAERRRHGRECESDRGEHERLLVPSSTWLVARARGHRADRCRWRP